MAMVRILTSPSLLFLHLTICRIYYIQIIYNAALILIFYLILEEIRGDVILKSRAAKLGKQNGRSIYAESELEKPSILNPLKISFMRPTKMLLTEPVVIFFTLWISSALGILLLCFSSLVQTFSAKYGFGTFQTGLIQLAITLGAAIGTFINPLQEWLYIRTASKSPERPGRPIPEGRLYTSIPGFILLTGSLFWYGWSSQSDIHWIVLAIGIFVVGVGIYSIYMGVVNYLTDAYAKYAVSALSAASLGRNTFGAFLPLASYSLFENLGFGWAGSLLGFIGAALSIVPVVLVIKGCEIRARSPYMLDATFDEGEATERRNSFGAGGEERRILSPQAWLGVLLSPRARLYRHALVLKIPTHRRNH